MKRVLALLLCFPLAGGESWAPKPDKIGHFVGGFAIGAAVTIGFKWGGGTAKQSARIGFMVGTGEGLRKEWMDHSSNVDATAQGLRQVHSASPADAAYTIAGAALGSWCAWELVKGK